jgi:hypothetical protein
VEATVGGNLTPYRDGVAVDSPRPITAAAANTAPTTIGARAYTGAEGYLTGDIAEIVAYDMALDPNNRQIVEAYLMSKYGLG